MRLPHAMGKFWPCLVWMGANTAAAAAAAAQIIKGQPDQERNKSTFQKKR